MLRLPKINKSKDLAIKFSLLFMSSIICLAGFELYARHFLKTDYFTFDGINKVWDKELARGFKIVDQDLGFIPGPLWEGNEGALGFQNGREHSVKNKHFLKVAVIGDSIIQSRLLEKAFKQLLKDRPIEIYNAGIGGYNTIQEAIYLQKHIKLTPNTLILGFCLNDFCPSLTVVSSRKAGRRKVAQKLYEPLGYANPWLFRNSALYRFIKLRSISFNKGNNLWASQTVIDNKERVKLGLRMMWEFCPNFFVIIYPHLEEYKTNSYLWQAHITIVEILSELRIPYLDLREIYRAYSFEELKINPADFCHPNEKAHLIAAREFIKKFYANFGLNQDERDHICAISL